MVFGIMVFVITNTINKFSLEPTTYYLLYLCTLCIFERKDIYKVQIFLTQKSHKNGFLVIDAKKGVSGPMHILRTNLWKKEV